MATLFELVKENARSSVLEVGLFEKQTEHQEQANGILA